MKFNLWGEHQLGLRELMYLTIMFWIGLAPLIYSIYFANERDEQVGTMNVIDESDWEITTGPAIWYETEKEIEFESSITFEEPVGNNGLDIVFQVIDDGQSETYSILNMVHEIELIKKQIAELKHE